jgi:hypothetical protein
MLPGLLSIFALSMKKIVVLIVALCYLVVTCGVVINFHYCMDRLASKTLFVSQDKKCGRCGMEIHQSNGCCRDEVQIVKMEEDQHKTTVASYDIPAPELQIVTSSAFIIAGFTNPHIRHYFHNHSPPLLSEQDTYLQNNVFRI